MKGQMNWMADKRKKRKIRPDRIAAAGLLLFLLVGIVLIVSQVLGKEPQEIADGGKPLVSEITTVATTTTTTTTETTTTTSRYPAPATRTTDTKQLSGDTDILARSVILIDAETQTMLAERDADAVLEPASMTKILTMVTAAETLTEEQLNGAFVMTEEIIAAQHARDAVCAGFQAGEPCSVTDLFYGMMLPSGADAATALAIAAAGSEAAFVQMMNDKAAEIGMDSSHFLNPTGLHEDGHVSTVHDIARLMEYALSIPFCRTVMSTPTYRTAATTQHPSGINLTSIVFWRMGDLAANGIRVCGGKTGFTNQAGQCLATWAEDENGKTYVCVVAGCEDQMDPVYDTLTVYSRYSGASDGAFSRPVTEETTTAEPAA